MLRPAQLDMIDLLCVCVCVCVRSGENASLVVVAVVDPAFRQEANICLSCWKVGGAGSK